MDQERGKRTESITLRTCLRFRKKGRTERGDDVGGAATTRVREPCLPRRWINGRINNSPTGVVYKGTPLNLRS